MTQPLASTAWHLGPAIPQSRRPWLRAIGWWLLQRAGWRFEGQMPDIPKFVVIVAPHTSNWDFPVGLAAKWALGFDAHWWGKDTLFRGPLGWFMRANGGIPVDRHHKSNVVDRTIDAFRTNERFALALSPEGTRKKVEAWRTGFWHVAKGANVPICCVALDWGRKVVRLGPTVRADEDTADAGIARLRGLFADIRGYDPTQRACPPPAVARAGT
ncbi:MAG: lysophospholipid acyltransferase family protein [Gemmatimonadaceae bacterium]